MQKTKNILILLLFVVMLVPLVTPVLLQLKIAMVQNEAEERMEKNHLQVLHIPLNDIVWTKKGRELLFNKRLFDVKEFSKTKTELILTGIYDDEETSLEKEMDGLWQEQQSKQGIILYKYFQVLAQIDLPQNISHAEKIITNKKNYHQKLSFYQKDIFIKIPTPPPQA